MAPENWPVSDARKSRLPKRFNEAGAHGPGKHPQRSPVAPLAPGFNEAGAHGPGKPRTFAGQSCFILGLQ